VVALLGIDLRGNAMELLGAGAVILSALDYAAAALLYRRWLADQGALAITALMTGISSAAFLPPAAIDLPRQVPQWAASWPWPHSGSSIPASHIGCFTC
jgi:drug/metabolite transporter (DMT)-like permease